MRILHTADLHAGKLLARQSRIEEAGGVFDEIVSIAQQEEVDAVLIAGDVFDQKAPAAEAEDLVYRTLLSLEQAGIHVILISGNHDNPQKWHALRPLFRRFHIHVVPEVARPEQGGLVEIRSRKSSERLQVAALPWVPLRRMVSAHALMSPEVEPYSRYADSMANLMRSLCRALDPEACTVFAGHLTVDGAMAGGGERVLTMGQTYAFEAQNFPQAQYVALGHVHRPQTLKNCPVPARYAGSPLQLDFGEVGYRTSVTVVDLTPTLPAQWREVPLTRGRRLMDAVGTLEELEAIKDSFEDAFLRVTLRCKKPVPGLGEQVREILPHALEVRLDYPRAERKEERSSVRLLSSREKFARYYQDKHKTLPEQEDLDLFQELLEESEGGVL